MSTSIIGATAPLFQSNIKDFIFALFEADDLILFRPLEAYDNLEGKKQTASCFPSAEYKSDRWPTQYLSRCDLWAFLESGLLGEQAARIRTNSFFGVCPRHKARSRNQSYDKACQIRQANTLWADIDNCPPNDALQRITAAGLPDPSFVVASGHGSHVYWLLDTPYRIVDAFQGPVYKNGKVPDISPLAKSLTDIIDGLAQKIGGDHTKDVSRLLRLPGTMNRKNERNGKTPVPCVLVESHPERKYPISEFTKYAVVGGPAKQPMGTITTTLPEPDIDEEGYEFPVPDDFQKLLDDCREEKGGDRSNNDYRLCIEAVEIGMPKENVWAMVKDISKFDTRGRKYFDRTWRRAKEKAKKPAWKHAETFEYISLASAPTPPPKQTDEELLAEMRVAGEKQQAEKDLRAYKPNLISAADFDKMVYKLEWLIKKVIVKDQPTILGGPKKSLKTNLLVDLWASLGTGGDFLGKYQATKTRVALISGESGRLTLQETARRICKSKSTTLANVDGYLDFRLPKLSKTEELAALVKALKQNKIEVVIIDPLYLCLLAGASEKQASNIFDMGPLLMEIAIACLEAGITPILAHHTIKHLAEPFSPMGLEDLAFSGIQEFARQWLLVNRRKAYNHAGFHQLWFTFGGSCGHGGIVALDIQENIMQDDGSGRVWEVEVMTVDEVKEKANLEGAVKKEESEEELRKQLLATLDSMILKLEAHSEYTDVSKTGLRDELKWGDPKFKRVYKGLLPQLEEYQGTVKIGNKATRTADCVRRKNISTEHQYGA